MTKEEHIKRHEDLHINLDELVADFIRHTEKQLSQSTILDLIEWSYYEKNNPTEEKDVPRIVGRKVKEKEEEKEKEKPEN
jgi:hypothetical protein